MPINIYVGNLPYKTSESDLADLFSRFGVVERSTIVKERDTGRSRGFGFVEMEDHAAGTLAIQTLLEEQFHGRPLTINEARPRGGGGPGAAHGSGSETGGIGAGSDASASANPGAQAGSMRPMSGSARPTRTSFGESIGYSNQLAGELATTRPDAADAHAAPASAPASEASPEPVSKGYSNKFLDR